jgi:hypothetical protein
VNTCSARGRSCSRPTSTMRSSRWGPVSRAPLAEAPTSPSSPSSQATRSRMRLPATGTGGRIRDRGRGVTGARRGGSTSVRVARSDPLSPSPFRPPIRRGRAMRPRSGRQQIEAAVASADVVLIPGFPLVRDDHGGHRTKRNAEERIRARESTGACTLGFPTETRASSVNGPWVVKSRHETLGDHIPGGDWPRTAGTEKFVPVLLPYRDAILALDDPRPALVQARLLAGRLARRVGRPLTGS